MTKIRKYVILCKIPTAKIRFVVFIEKLKVNLKKTNGLQNFAK